MSAPVFASYLLLWGLVLAQTLILLGMTRAFARSQRHSELVAPPSTVSSERAPLAPSFRATDVFGTWIDTADYVGKLFAVLFVSPTCPGCTVTLEELGALRGKAKGSVIVICQGTREACGSIAAEFKRVVPVIADPALRISASFEVDSVPVAFIIDEHYRLQSHGEPGRPSIPIDPIRVSP